MFFRSRDDALPGNAFLAGLKRALGMSVTDFSFRHSLLPFYCAVSTHSTVVLGGFRSASPDLLRVNANRKHLFARFCPLCAQCDQASFGFSYWRRVHQLPGIERCIEHGGPLRTVASPLAINTMPGDHRIQDAHCSPRVKGANATQITMRYTQCVQAFLHLPRPIALKRFVHVLSCRASSLNLSKSRRASLKKRSLLDLAQSTCCRRWLDRTFSARNRSARMALRNIARIFTLSTTISAPIFALAIALLCESDLAPTLDLLIADEDVSHGP
jgi:hypothetical protein